MPVPPAMDIRVREAGCLDDAEAAPDSGPGRGLVAEEQVIGSQPASADVSQELGGDLGAELEPPVLLVLRVVLDQEPAA